MADASDSKSDGGDLVRVQVPPSALEELMFVSSFFVFNGNKNTSAI